MLDRRELPIDKPQKPDRAAALVSLNQLDEMENHGLELLRRALARVGEINIVLEAGFGEVRSISPFCRKCVRGVYGHQLVIVRPV